MMGGLVFVFKLILPKSKKKNRSRGSCLCSFARCQFRSTHPSRPHQSSSIFVLRFGSIFPNILVVFSCKYFGCIFANIFVLFFLQIFLDHPSKTTSVQFCVIQQHLFILFIKSSLTSLSTDRKDFFI